MSVEQTEGILNSIEELRKKQSQRLLETTYENKDIRTVITYYKKEHGGYGELGFSWMYSDKHSKDFPKYFDRDDERWNNCDDDFAPIRKWFGEPKAIRDLSFDPPRQVAFGWYSDELEAEWQTSTIAVQYSCNKLFFPVDFYKDGVSISDLDAIKAKDVQKALNFLVSLLVDLMVCLALKVEMP